MVIPPQISNPNLLLKSSPLIAVIVAVFNGSKTLQQCIDSVTRQTYPDKELIIIDGVSKDGTVGLLEANQEHISYWISEPDKGIYNAWNKGLSEAKGEWICFLGADNFFWDAAILIDPDDASQLTSALTSCMDNRLCQNLVKAGKIKLQELDKELKASELALISILTRFEKRLRCWKET